MIKMMMAVVGLTLAAGVAAAPAQELQARFLANKVSTAMHDPNDARGESICEGDGRTAEGVEDRAVVAAGWIPFFAAQQIGTTRVLTAAASLDGQCRPLGLAVFVFRAGKAVGVVAARDPSAAPTIRLNDANTF